MRPGLDPCPFCGSVYVEEQQEGQMKFACCTICKARGPSLTVEEDEERDLFKFDTLWNNRVGVIDEYGDDSDWE